MTNPDAPARPTAVTPDGFIYDQETGEVLGHSEAPQSFRIEDPSAADWALDLRARVEADLLAVRRRKAALVANLAELEKAHERRLAWWDSRFRPDLVAFARRVLAGGRSRTLRLDYGAIRFRSSAGTNRVTDMDAAVAFAQSYAPDQVRVARSVTAGGVLAAVARFREANGCDPAVASFLESTGPRETVTIETGVDND